MSERTGRYRVTVFASTLIGKTEWTCKQATRKSNVFGREPPPFLIANVSDGKLVRESFFFNGGGLFIFSFFFFFLQEIETIKSIALKTGKEGSLLLGYMIHLFLDTIPQLLLRVYDACTHDVTLYTDLY